MNIESQGCTLTRTSSRVLSSRQSLRTSKAIQSYLYSKTYSQYGEEVMKARPPANVDATSDKSQLYRMYLQVTFRLKAGCEVA